VQVNIKHLIDAPAQAGTFCPTCASSLVAPGDAKGTYPYSVISFIPECACTQECGNCSILAHFGYSPLVVDPTSSVSSGDGTFGDEIEV